MSNKIDSIIEDTTKILENLNDKKIAINYFQIISHGYEDENAHSNLIAWLLDPINDKNCRFLKIFLQNVLQDIPREKYPQDFNQIMIYREYNHIDILITDHQNFVIAIENKVNSTIEYDQLKNHKAIVEEYFPAKSGFCQKYVAITKKGDTSKVLPKIWMRIKYDQIMNMVKKIKTDDDNEYDLLLNHYKDALDQMLDQIDKKLKNKLSPENFKRLSTLYEAIFNINDFETKDKIKINNLLKKYVYILNKILFHNYKILNLIIIKYLELKKYIIDKKKAHRIRYFSEELLSYFSHPVIYNREKEWSSIENIFSFQISNNNNSKTLVLSFLLGPISSEYNFVKKDILDQIKSKKTKLLNIHKQSKGSSFYTTLYTIDLLKKDDYNVFGLQNLKTKLDSFKKNDYQIIKEYFTENDLKINYD